MRLPIFGTNICIPTATEKNLGVPERAVGPTGDTCPEQREHHDRCENESASAVISQNAAEELSHRATTS